MFNCLDPITVELTVDITMGTSSDHLLQNFTESESVVLGSLSPPVTISVEISADLITDVLIFGVSEVKSVMYSL